jgi:DNA helicase-2/ATP-dependent DNA helicase PcrA
VVGRNVHRESKSLWTENDEGARVTVLSCEDERDEAAMLVKLMQMLLEAGHARRDLAVLYRTHALSRVIEEGLRFANLPYRVVGGLRFYDRAEVKDLLAYLRVIANPDDDVSLLRIVNTPPRGIGKTTIDRLLDSAARAGGSVWQALSLADDDPAHSAAARKSLERFGGLLTTLRKMAAEGSGPALLAKTVLDQTGYAQVLREEDSAEADARLENLQEVLGSMMEFEQEAEEPTLSAFLELVTLQTDGDRKPDDDSITLMTVHAAKGLEFPVVMVAGLEEETFPHRGMAPEDDPDDLEEERRLAYVAFTRARQRLFLSHAHQRRVYGELRQRIPSRFFDEMPPQELERVGGRGARRSAGVPEQRFMGAGRGLGRPQLAQRGAAPRTSTPPGDSRVDRFEGSDMPHPSDMDEGAELRLGMRVRHSKFGVGQVRAVTPGSPPRVTVTFPGWGEKTLVTSFLEPA